MIGNSVVGGNLGLTVPGYEKCNLGLQSQVMKIATWDFSPRLFKVQPGTDI